MSDPDIIKLYSKKILALTASIPHCTRLIEPQGSAERRSAICGSMVRVDVDVSTGKIARFGQEVRACALGQASAAVLGKVVIGRTRNEIERAAQALEQMLSANGAPPDAPFDGLEVLLPAKDYPNRHASILLPFTATLAAFEQAISPAQKRI